MFSVQISSSTKIKLSDGLMQWVPSNISGWCSRYLVRYMSEEMLLSWCNWRTDWMDQNGKSQLKDMKKDTWRCQGLDQTLPCLPWTIQSLLLFPHHLLYPRKWQPVRLQGRTSPHRLSPPKICVMEWKLIPTAETKKTLS